MFTDILAAMMPGALAQRQFGQQGQQGAPGQEARQQGGFNFQDIMSMVQPKSGAVDLGKQIGQQQQLGNQMLGFNKDMTTGAPGQQMPLGGETGPDGRDLLTGMVLPNRGEAGSGQGPGMGVAPPMSLMGGPVAGGGMQTMNVGSSGGMRPQQEPNYQQPSSVPWGDLLNFQGNMKNPNILTRGGFGYNEGGLLGALGLMMTNMNTNRDSLQMIDPSQQNIQ